MKMILTASILFPIIMYVFVYEFNADKAWKGKVVKENESWVPYTKSLFFYHAPIGVNGHPLWPTKWEYRTKKEAEDRLKEWGMSY